MLITLYIMLGLGLGLGTLNEKSPDALRFVLVAIFWPLFLTFLIGRELSE
jgi:hypothetical protein